MLKLRLRRTGAKKQPAYRLVVAEATAPRDGTFLEILGHYNPLTEPTTFEFKEDRVREWLKQGAQPTDRVARLLSSRGIMPAPAYAASVPTPSATPAAATPAAPRPAAAPAPATAAAPPAAAVAAPEEADAAAPVEPA